MEIEWDPAGPSSNAVRNNRAWQAQKIWTEHPGIVHDAVGRVNPRQGLKTLKQMCRKLLAVYVREKNLPFSSEQDKDIEDRGH